jgi:hypothetical protein
MGEPDSCIGHGLKEDVVANGERSGLSINHVMICLLHHLYIVVEWTCTTYCMIVNTVVFQRCPS